MSFIEFLLWKYDQSLPGLFVKIAEKDMHVLEHLNAVVAKANKLAEEKQAHETRIQELEKKVESGGFEGARANIQLKMVRTYHVVTHLVTLKFPYVHFQSSHKELP